MKKRIPVIIITIIFVLYFLFMLVLYITAYKGTNELLFLLTAIIPLIGLYYLITTLSNRLKEIKEEDDDVTRKY